MSIWARLLEMVAGSPLTGTWMSPATALLALLALVGTRRLLRQEDRHHGRTLLVFLVIGLVLGLLRLGLFALGAHRTTAAVIIGILTTFFVTMGVVGTAIIFFLVFLPARLRLRVPSILRDSIQAGAFVLIAFAALSQSGINVASQIATAGVLTAVIGLALQNTIANVFAGLMLNMDRELGEFDWVQVGQRTGQVVQIRWRSTILRTVDGDFALIPNSQMLSGEVYNYSRPSLRHRRQVRVVFHYRHAPNHVRKVIAEAVREVPGVLPEPAADVIVLDFADNGVVYMVRFWIESFGRKADIESEVHARIWYAAQRAGLEFPYATRTVHLVTDDGEADADERSARLRAVERVDLFAPLAPDERERMAANMRRVSFAAGEHILRQGDPGDSLYIIAHGEVRVSLEQLSGEHPVATLGQGDFFGEMSLMTGAPRSAACRAVTDVVVYVIDRAIARDVLSSRPTMAEEMSAILATRQAALARNADEHAGTMSGRPEHRKRLLTKIRDFFDLD
jgi:small-conductance mechanosensitive channel/CRP-like cAMP-binding protein